MASAYAHSRKSMKRLESKKSHSWWWDSHISPKNNKWLMENLEEMDRNVKRMLKLIEEDGDSFAKKAEMYYQKRPELVSLVEEFYRMYRSLAERYDNVTGELRKSVPVDLQSQGSNASDLASDLPSSSPSPAPAPDRPPLARRSSGHRAAGFDFFLGSGDTTSDHGHKEGDESSTLTDSDSESDDDSSVNNYSGPIAGHGGGDQALAKKIMELEAELRETKENSNDLASRIAEYELELKRANQRIHSSEDEIDRLKCEHEKCNKPFEHINASRDAGAELEPILQPLLQLEEGEEGETLSGSSSNDKIVHSLAEELRITRMRLQESEREIASLRQRLESNDEVSDQKVRNLQDQLASARKDIAAWKSKVNSERKEVSKLQERVSRLKASLTDRDQEARELKTAVSDAERKIFPEKAQIKAEITKLLEEQSGFREQLREWESRGRCLEDDIRRLQAEKAEMEERHCSETEQLKAEMAELVETVSTLRTERDMAKQRADAVEAELVSQEQQIDEMEKHLEELHKELVGVVSAAEEARRKAKELEEEVEKQRKLVEESAEEKREAIRQLCVSIEHYRVGYHELRQAFAGAGGHGRVAVLAA
ncbi:unnamed protein product [Linum tenue]|uniref:NAB domain-containing protein n=1 Tax=Linum tenue TaxID=586396 RepID=A0AAV0LAH0_9ROSI|nr:unnamed protein product [Linum tenue]